MKLFIFVFITTFPVFSNFAQTQFFEKPQAFDRSNVPVQGRVRMVSIKKLGPAMGTLAVALVRKGSYPELKLELQFWKCAKKSAPKLKLTLPMPSDLHFYDIAQFGETVGLVLVRDKDWEWWTPQHGNWENLTKSTFKLSAPFQYGDPGEASAFESQLDGQNKNLWIPSAQGVSVYEFVGLEKPRLKSDLTLPMRGYYKSSIGSLAFEFPFWIRNSVWYPSLFQKGSSLMVPWMDELAIFPDAFASKSQTVYFKRLTEDEREDAQAYVVTIPTDLNGDHQTDVIINKFKGAATQMTAETTLHYADATGQINVKGIALPSQGNRAAGAFPNDLNKDGKTDLISASSQFNVWSIIQALTRRQVDVSFNIYFGSEKGIAQKPSFTREITFGFDLSDLALKGFLPNLDGDFNGDGYKDALYARNEKEITVILQQVNATHLFADVPSANYEVAVRRQNALGDLDEDGKTDVILFDRRTGKNKDFTVLMNTGLMK